MKAFILVVGCLFINLGCDNTGNADSSNNQPTKGQKKNITNTTPLLSKGLISGKDNAVCVVLNDKLNCFSEPPSYFQSVWADMLKTSFQVAAITNTQYAGSHWASSCGITKNNKVACFKFLDSDVTAL